MTAKEVLRVRKSLHLSQEEFARLIGVSFATVNRWENNHSTPLPDRARKIRELAGGRPPRQSEIRFGAGAGKIKLPADKYLLEESEEFVKSVWGDWQS